MRKPSFEERLRRVEGRAFPQPGSIEHDRMILAQAKRRLRETEAASADEPPPPERTTAPPVPPAPRAAPAPASPPPSATEPPPKQRPKLKRLRAPEPEPQWWEEKARWRRRGPEDYRWGNAKANTCIVDYEPLAALDDEE